MKTKKVYAKIIDCDDTTIYCDDDAIFNDRLCAVFKEYNQFSGFNYEIIKQLYNDIYNYSDYDLSSYYKNNLASLIIDNLKSIKRLSLKDGIELAQAIKKDMQFNDFACLALSKLYDGDYKHTTIRGCCQGDYATLYYDSKTINDDTVNYIEAVFFGTGTEVMIHEGDRKPRDANHIEGYTFYTAAYSIDEIKKEIAQYENVNVNDVVLYTIKTRTSYTVTKYEYEVN